jgi:hypothetical protein
MRQQLRAVDQPRLQVQPSGIASMKTGSISRSTEAGVPTAPPPGQTVPLMLNATDRRIGWQVPIREARAVELGPGTELGLDWRLTPTGPPSP